MKLKRIFSLLLCMSICGSFVGNTISIAADNSSEIVYRTENDEGVEDQITLSDLEMEYWNSEELSDVPPEIYAYFPIRVDRAVDDECNMKLLFTYLKNFEYFDEINVNVLNIQSNEIIIDQNITSGNKSIELNVLTDQAYKVIITEKQGSDYKEYSKIIVTSIEDAGFPKSISLNETKPEDNIICGNVFIADTQDLINRCSIGSDGNTVIDGEKNGYEVVNANQIQEYCESLPGNHLYKLETRDTNNNTYSGFLSTAPNEYELGIFVPSYKMYTNEEYERLLSSTTTMDIENADGYVANPAQVVGTARRCERYMDYIASLPYDGKNYKVYAFTPDEDGSYTFKATSNSPVHMQIWSLNDNGVFSFGGTRTGFGNTASYNISTVYGVTYYFVVYLSDNDYTSFQTGKALFTVKYNDEGDDISGNFTDYIVNQSIVSNKLTPTGSWRVHTLLDFHDVDLFCFGRDASITGSIKYTLQFNNNSSTNMCVEIFKYTAGEPVPTSYDYISFAPGSSTSNYTVNTTTGDERYIAMVYSNNQYLGIQQYRIRMNVAAA